MRLRFTVLLLLANAALFTAIWSLEREPAPEARRAESVPFTTLEISGKGIDKPRVLKLENNRWRIVSPIDWSANLFAVNRIRNQIEFLDKEASFPLSEIKSRGYKLSEYGLDDPAYTVKYGNDKKSYVLKIGKSAPAGDRVYMLDEANGRIVVVDREFVESLVVDTERLRNQNVFDIQRFEVSAFSVRLPSAAPDTPLKGDFRRVGLVRDGAGWKFETPIVAAADSNEVDAFLGEICKMPAKSFPNISPAEAGFEVSALPTTLAIEGTNRRQVLLLGGKTKDGSQVYARLEDNPTVFTLDASIMPMLSEAQTTLREKSALKFDISKVAGLDISRAGSSLKFGKLKSGVWDVVGAGENGKPETFAADAAAVNRILILLSRARIRKFVSDAPGENVARYGIKPDSLRIAVTEADGQPRGLTFGSRYSEGGAGFVYARADGSEAVFGISDEILSAAGTDILAFRSKIVGALPEKASVKSLLVRSKEGGKTLFKIEPQDGDFSRAFAELPVRKRNSAKKLLEYARSFAAKSYAGFGFDPNGASAGGKLIPWEYELVVGYEVRGTGAAVAESASWLFTKRLGGTTQYGGSAAHSATFLLENALIDSLFELLQDSIVSETLKKPEAALPSKN